MPGLDLDSEFVQQLDRDILAFIEQGVDHADEAAFTELSLREFTFQFDQNPFYREFCLSRGVTPEKAVTWQDIPALPARHFKERVIASFPLERAKLQYLSSGTTDPQARTRTYRDERATELVFAANRIATRAFLFPDVERMPVLLMVPSPEVAPQMGMAVGLTVMKDSFGTADSRYLITPAGIDAHALYGALFQAEASGNPIALVGATSGFIFLFNLMAEQNLRFRLPAGSRIADGGGYMGTFGDCSREEYLAKAWDFLGVPPEYCVNTLGMAECGQNFLDNVLRQKVLGQPAPVRFKPSLPWARVLVADPETGRPVPRGETGLLCHYDLTNRAMVFAVVSDNLGYEVGDGFEILGRNSQGQTTGTKAEGMVCASTAENMVCSSVADGMICSSVADKMLAGGQTCGSVAEGMVCSSVADGMICSSIADKMLAAGAPKFIVEMVAKKLANGETVRHPFSLRSGDGSSGQKPGNHPDES